MILTFILGRLAVMVGRGRGWAAAVAFNKTVLASAGSLSTAAVAGLRKLKASWVSAPCSCPAVLRGSLLAQG